MLDITPTERFSSRVANYARFRPSYPPEIIGILKRECGLTPGSVILVPELLSNRTSEPYASWLSRHRRNRRLSSFDFLFQSDPL